MAIVGGELIRKICIVKSQNFAYRYILYSGCRTRCTGADIK